MVAYGEIKDSLGRPIIRKDGYAVVGKNGFAEGDARWISFPSYSGYKYIPFSLDSFSYRYDYNSGDEQDSYVDNKPVAVVNDLILRDGKLVYSVDDSRSSRKSIKEIAISLDGKNGLWVS